MSDWIVVTVKEDGDFLERKVDPMQIDYLNPVLHGCIIHFVNDDESINVFQDEKELRELVRQWYKREFQGEVRK